MNIVIEGAINPVARYPESTTFRLHSGVQLQIYGYLYPKNSEPILIA